MTQPTRWLDDRNVPIEIRDLLRAGSRPPHFPKALLLASVVPLAQKAALASSWAVPSTALVAVKATAVGLAIGLGSLAAVTAVSNPDAVSTKPVLKATPSSAVSTRVSPRTTTESKADDSQEVGHETRSAQTAAPRVLLPAPPPGPATSVEVLQGPAGIAAEAGLLERARSLLDESPARALLLTDEHRTQYAAGQLAAERELIAIDALLRLGRQSEAQQRARPFLSDGANQIFAQRLRNLLSRHGQ